MNTFFLITYIIITLLAFLSIVFYGSRPAKSLSWTLIIVLLPFVGVLLYLILGINRRKLKFLTLKQTARRQAYNDVHFARNTYNGSETAISKPFRRTKILLASNKGFYPKYNNKVEVLDNGKQTFDTIFSAIKKAKHYIHLQYYIFEEGELLDKLYDLLQKKIAEGVEVRMLYDQIGSFYWKKKSIKKFKNIGAEVLPILPLRLGSIIFSLNYRNHRKIIVVDGKVGFTGGFNVSDKYIKDDTFLGTWEDTHLHVEGTVVDDLQRVFAKDYYFASNGKQLNEENYIKSDEVVGTTTVQLVSDGPDSEFSSILHQYLKLIATARTNITIANPYIIPNTALLEALKIASRSGVEVNILIPEKTDSKLAKYSMYSYFDDLLIAGVSIYRLSDNFLHSKVLIIDDSLASVGSGNFDVRSFEHNFETNMVIYDKKIAKTLIESFSDSFQSSYKIDPEVFKNRSWKEKLLEGLARFFSPLL